MDHDGSERRGDGDRPQGLSVSDELFREALSHWASTVTVVAVNQPERVYAVTATSFIPISADPPHVLVSMSPNANVIPFLETGSRFGVSLLEEGQGRIATVMADAFPVGPSPFDEAEPDAPLVTGSVVALACSVVRVIRLTTGVHLVVGRVDSARIRPESKPLLYYRRGYAGLA